MMTKQKDSAKKAIRDIRRATRRQYSAEEKIRIVLEGLRGESSIAELCRKEGINQNLYYRWSKEFLEAGKKRLAGDTARKANSDEVKGLRSEAAQLNGFPCGCPEWLQLAASFCCGCPEWLLPNGFLWVSRMGDLTDLIQG